MAGVGWSKINTLARNMGRDELRIDRFIKGQKWGVISKLVGGYDREGILCSRLHARIVHPNLWTKDTGPTEVPFFARMPLNDVCFVSERTDAMIEIYMGNSLASGDVTSVVKPGDTIIINGRIVETMEIEANFVYGKINIECAGSIKIIPNREQRRRAPRWPPISMKKPSLVLDSGNGTKLVSNNIIDISPYGAAFMYDYFPRGLLKKDVVLKGTIGIPVCDGLRTTFRVELIPIECEIKSFAKVLPEEIKVAYKFIYGGDEPPKELISYSSNIERAVRKTFKEFLNEVEKKMEWFGYT